MTSDLILHQYALSPFSEKIRLMLGYTVIPWQAVTVREMPPRPHLEALTGGYRKIPVAQIGADVFCDTRVIAAEIAAMSGKPALDPARVDTPVREFSETADLEVFLATLIASSGPGMLVKLVRETSMMDTFRFLKDRVSIGRKAKVQPMGGREAKHRLTEQLDQMAALLTRDYLFGEQPSIADFSAYHSLWYARDLAGKPVFKDHASVGDWMNRMQAFGHGTWTPMSIEAALETARAASPRPLPESVDDSAIGEFVSVAPSDYARDPVHGTLVAATDSRWILRHDDPQVGEVHVHFPRAGFRLGPAPD